MNKNIFFKSPYILCMCVLTTIIFTIFTGEGFVIGLPIHITYLINFAKIIACFCISAFACLLINYVLVADTSSWVDDLLNECIFYLMWVVNILCIFYIIG